ncbi:SMI1/KNR4 family protein [Sporosarcina sp. HYO08]|uniref:SMI1/KNR4 family protein n=1 Tax=Sporosarcina sp. HYO08 TaxID=1759557 RepID=UPI00079B1CDF|nr:SMI1/KNR4 family protein [Sporosarcina sp. HYO08]KXH87241.1 hypothetical protein AU377_01320 [Sporosarcina sp. HYO08]
MDYRTEILHIIEKEKILDFKTLKNKTVLINKAYETGVEGWVHHIFHPLPPSDIDLLEKKTKKKFPEPYKKFLSLCNGIFLFGGDFYIYGKGFLEKGMSREEQLYQPYDLIEEIEDPPCKIPGDMFYFGGTPKTIFAIEVDGSVVELTRRSAKLVFRYESFDCWLMKKIQSTTGFGS